jgi:hypothetical protein
MISARHEDHFLSQLPTCTDAANKVREIIRDSKQGSVSGTLKEAGDAKLS